jgi:hypothetical protein
MHITTGSGSFIPSKADVYTPTPKNAALAREIYPVGPENMLQLTVRAPYIKTVVSNMTE